MTDSVSDGTGWSRRKVLTARGLGASAGGLLGVLLPDLPAADFDRKALLSTICYARRAMACEFSVFLPPTVEQGMPVGDARCGSAFRSRVATRVRELEANEGALGDNPGEFGAIVGSGVGAG